MLRGAKDDETAKAEPRAEPPKTAKAEPRHGESKTAKAEPRAALRPQPKAALEGSRETNLGPSRACNGRRQVPPTQPEIVAMNASIVGKRIP